MRSWGGLIWFLEWWGMMVASGSGLLLVRLAEGVLVGVQVEVIEPWGLGAVHIEPIVALEMFL